MTLIAQSLRRSELCVPIAGYSVYYQLFSFLLTVSGRWARVS